MSTKMNQVWTGVAVAAAVVASTIMFGGRVDGQETRAVRTQPVEMADVNQLRADLIEVSSIYFELGTIFQSENIMSAASEAIITFESMSDDQLSNFVNIGPKTTELRSAVANLRDLIINQVSQQMAEANSPGFPDASYSFLCGSVRSNTEVFFLARLAYEIAQGIWSGLSRACEEVVAGFNLSLLCIPVDLVLFAAQITVDEIANCDEDIDAAEIEGTYDRVGHIHGDVEVLQSTVDTLLDMVEELRLANCDIIRLLHTPQGQRESDLSVCDDQPEFPYGWPEN